METRTRGLWEKFDARRRVLPPGKSSGSPREQEDRRVVGFLSFVVDVVSRMARSHDSHTRCVPCVCARARTRVPEGREGREGRMEEDDDDEEEEERRRKRRRRRRRRARDTAVYYRGSVPRIASRKPRKKDGDGARWTRVGAEAEERGARERPNYAKRDVGRRGWDS